MKTLTLLLALVLPNLTSAVSIEDERAALILAAQQNQKARAELNATVVDLIQNTCPTLISILSDIPYPKGVARVSAMCAEIAAKYMEIQAQCSDISNVEALKRIKHTKADSEFLEASTDKLKRCTAMLDGLSETEEDFIQELQTKIRPEIMAAMAKR